MNNNLECQVRNKVLISFLGNTLYNDSIYYFDENSTPISASYFGASIVQNMCRENCPPTHYYVCGTKTSMWLLFFQNTLKVIKEHLGIDLPEGVVAKIQQLCKEGADNRNFTEELLQEITSNINEVTSSKNFQVKVFVHPFEAETFKDQTVLFDSMLPVIPDNSEIYLDITNGLRTMPMISFLTVKTLKNLSKNIFIKKIYYAKMDSIDTNKRRDLKINKIFSRLKSLSEKGSFEEQQKIASQIKELTSKLTPKKTPDVGTVIEVLETENYFNLAENLSQFNITGNYSILTDSLASLNNGQLNEDSMNKLASNIKKITVAESVGLGSVVFPDTYKNLNAEAGDLFDYRSDDCVIKHLLNAIKKKTKIKTSDFSDSSKSANSSMNLEISDGSSNAKNDYLNYLKSLAVSFFNFKDYARAIHFLSLAIEEEFITTKSNDPKVIKEELHCNLRKHSKELQGLYNKLFMGTFRAQYIHMEDKSSSLVSEQAKLRKMLESDTYISELHNLMIKFGCVFPTDNKNSNPNNHLLVTFLGSGGYLQTSYKVGESYLPSSTFMAFPLLHLDKSISKMLVIGTSTSAWDEFFANLESNYPEIQEVKELHTTVLNIWKEKNQLLEDDVNLINGRLKKINDLLNMQIVICTVNEESHTKYDYYKIFNFLYLNISNNSFVDMDITHCFRQFPIIMYSAMLLLREIKNLNIEHVYYGNIVPHSIAKCEGLDEVKLLMKVLRGSDTADNDLVFNQVADAILDILAKYDEKPTNGSIYDFKSLLALSDNALSIGEFEKTGNINYLIPLFNNYQDIQHKLEGASLYEDICLFDYCRDLFAEVVDFVKNCEDPIISKLKQQIIDKLSWITLESQNIDITKLTQQEIKKHVGVCRCLDRAHFYLDKKYPDYFKSILYAYQTATYLHKGKESASDNVLNLLHLDKKDINKLSDFKKYRNKMAHKIQGVDVDKYSEEEMTKMIQQILAIVAKYL